MVTSYFDKTTHKTTTNSFTEFCFTALFKLPTQCYHM